MLGLRRVIELAGVSLVGMLISMVLFAVPPKEADEIPGGSFEPVDETPSAASASVKVDNTADTASWLEQLYFGRYWKLTALMGLMIVIEMFKESNAQGGFSLMRVLKLESFREALRGLAQGQGLPPMPTAEEAAEAEAMAAADYANQRAASKREAAAAAAAAAVR